MRIRVEGRMENSGVEYWLGWKYRGLFYVGDIRRAQFTLSNEHTSANLSLQSPSFPS